MSAKFGWCLDNHHEGCRVSIDYGAKFVRYCICPCHEPKDAA